MSKFWAEVVRKGLVLFKFRGLIGFKIAFKAWKGDY